jgi:hypothetical protein
MYASFITWCKSKPRQTPHLQRFHTASYHTELPAQEGLSHLTQRKCSVCIRPLPFPKMSIPDHYPMSPMRSDYGQQYGRIETLQQRSVKWRHMQASRYGRFYSAYVHARWFAPHGTPGLTSWPSVFCGNGKFFAQFSLSLGCIAHTATTLSIWLGM